jgi:hypothetical protein
MGRLLRLSCSLIVAPRSEPHIPRWGDWLFTPSRRVALPDCPPRMNPPMLEHEHSQGYVGLAFLAGVSYLLDFLSEIVLPVVLFLAALAAFGFLGALIRYYVVGHWGA